VNIIKTWTVSDVCRWLDSLSLSQYTSAFSEGSVDGPFLMELREEDLVQVLGIRHKLHVKKILISREKLKPLSQQEMLQYQTVVTENRNKKLCELLLLRGANINNQNAAGNTALHYAVEMDPSGQLAEYLVEHNADDTIENIDGLTPYDGTAK
jgi:ankyrin repeat protein